MSDRTADDDTTSVFAPVRLFRQRTRAYLRRRWSTTRGIQTLLTGILRQYFNTVDNFAQPFTDIYGGAYLRFPYGSFFDTTTQTAASTTAAYPITLNTTSSYQLCRTVASSSQITFAVSGFYNIQFSVQLANVRYSTAGHRRLVPQERYGHSQLQQPFWFVCKEISRGSVPHYWHC
jgi:hypothetical protein